MQYYQIENLIVTESSSLARLSNRGTEAITCADSFKDQQARR